jgi:hypothetical protein
MFSSENLGVVENTYVLDGKTTLRIKFIEIIIDYKE